MQMADSRFSCQSSSNGSHMVGERTTQQIGTRNPVGGSVIQWHDYLWNSWKNGAHQISSLGSIASRPACRGSIRPCKNWSRDREPWHSLQSEERRDDMWISAPRHEGQQSIYKCRRIHTWPICWSWKLRSCWSMYTGQTGPRRLLQHWETSSALEKTWWSWLVDCLWLIYSFVTTLSQLCMTGYFSGLSQKSYSIMARKLYISGQWTQYLVLSLFSVPTKKVCVISANFICFNKWKFLDLC